MPTYTLIRCGQLYDGQQDTLQTGMEILIEDDIIREVDKKVAAPAGCAVIDLSHLTVTPGLSDAHVHLGTGNWRERPREIFYESPTFKGMAVLYNAKKALMRGFTTLRHCGTNSDDGYGSVTAKRMIDAGYFEGARLVVAPHYLGATNGHGDSSQNMSGNPAFSTWIWHQYPGYGFGADMFKERVREQVKFGADFIKVFATGGFSTPSDGPEDITLDDDELRAIIQTAHALGKKVTSHTYAPNLAKKQVEMGIDGIEHGALIDCPETLALMKARGTDLVPTFTPYEDIIHLNESSLKSKPEAFRKKLYQYAEWLSRARKAIIASDLDLGYGTDMVTVYNPYDCGMEFRVWMLNGVDPFRALAAATRVNAKIMELEGQIGAIAPGYRADIAGWASDLMTDPDALKACAFVMKDGVQHQTEASVW